MSFWPAHVLLYVVEVKEEGFLEDKAQRLRLMWARRGLTRRKGKSRGDMAKGS